LVFGKIIKIFAIRGRIFRFKCTEFYFGCAPDPIAGFKGPTWGGREDGKGKGGEEM